MYELMHENGILKHRIEKAIELLEQYIKEKHNNDDLELLDLLGFKDDRDVKALKILKGETNE